MKPKEVAELLLKGAAVALALGGMKADRIASKVIEAAMAGERLRGRVQEVAGDEDEDEDEDETEPRNTEN